MMQRNPTWLVEVSTGCAAGDKIIVVDLLRSTGRLLKVHDLSAQGALLVCGARFIL